MEFGSAMQSISLSSVSHLKLLFYKHPLIKILGDVAYLWWYDSESAIQSYGINFVQDLPYFLVLLLCFDRFNDCDWGIITSLTKCEDGRCQLTFPSSPSHSAVDIIINPAEHIRHHFGLLGRRTQMLPALSQSKDLRDASKSLADLELVAKKYWPEESRTGEADVIKKAYKIAQRNNDVNGHLPVLIISHDFTEYSTKGIRVAFGIQSQGHRVLRIILFVRLYPITDLIGEPFWKAFRECFRCKCSL
jgi:hypothetical protein